MATLQVTVPKIDSNPKHTPTTQDRVAPTIILPEISSQSLARFITGAEGTVTPQENARASKRVKTSLINNRSADTLPSRKKIV